MKTLSFTPPMTQLNTAYPATSYLTGFLQHNGYDASQRDLAIEVFLRYLSREGLADALEVMESQYLEVDDDDLPDTVFHFMAEFEAIQTVVEPVVRFLQGKDTSLAMRISSRRFLPEGPCFEALNDLQTANPDAMQWAFGDLGTQDKAKYLATLFIDDVAAAIQQGVDAHFEMSRYGERLAASNPSFDDLDQALQYSSLTERFLNEAITQHLSDEQPDLIVITVPFPGNMLAALQTARTCKRFMPNCPVLLGGGYVNTELRQLKEARLFDYVDYITLDDGERPLLNLIDYLFNGADICHLVRTYHRPKKHVVYRHNPEFKDIPHQDTGTPTYQGLTLDNYLSLSEVLNPMHRIWSDGRWNKLTVAHGCYWGKCSFCDISLDYINRYDDASAECLVERIKAQITETGQTGFHFVDEAAPPKVLFALAQKLIDENITISWWGNIRFEKTFTPERCQLLADSGCVAISGGLEVASDRLLTLMKKGVSVEQVARVTKAFANAGVLVHAYLMYGFPTQTEAETLESLERVRQLMETGCIHSAYWHRFAATVHSPVGLAPDDYGITLIPRPNSTFARNDIDFIDPVGTNHEQLGEGLRKALYNYMHGMGFDQPLQTWFDHSINEPHVDPYLIEKALNA